MRTDSAGRSQISTNRLIAYAIGFALVLMIAISMVASSGTADPTEAANPTLATSIINSSVIVFREGLEAVLIFAAVTASFLGKRRRYRRPVLLGVAAASVTTVLTWIVMQAILGSFDPAYSDVLQAVTGMIAIGVLLVVMNWFFHKVYWTGWISLHNRRKRALISEAEQAKNTSRATTAYSRLLWGLIILGFTSVYREGFEVVLFLQSLQLKSGTAAVMWGVLLGLAGTTVVGFLTFYAHHKLPYKKMLALTGVLLGMVLVVMVGGTARTLQDLGWISTTPLGMGFPDWWARWFELVPTVETILFQVTAGGVVVGSYYAAEWWAQKKRDEIAGRRAVVEQAAFNAREQVAGVPSFDRGPSPAAVRGAAFAAEPDLVPTSICGTPATTFCGASALKPIAAAEIEAHRPAAVPAVPTPIAPIAHPRPLVADAARLNQRPPLFSSRPLFADLGAGASLPAQPKEDSPAAQK
jgi:high-affinity iron transporter